MTGFDSQTRRHAPRVAVVIGSTRPGRISPTVARWVRDVLGQASPLQYEILDLADIGLPLLDEPSPAAFGHYELEHTKRWSRIVTGYDGFVFVYPQYNWGYPAVVKNALDFLYHEWHGKPATLFTWSITGGAKGAAQLLQVLQCLHMDPLPTRVEAAITHSDVDADQQLVDPERTFAPTRARLRAIDQEFSRHLTRSQ